MNDSGNRAFWSIVVTAAGGHALLAGSLCCVAMVVTRQVRNGAWAHGVELLPGVILLALTALGGGLALARLIVECNALRGLRKTLRSRRVPPSDHARCAASAAGLGTRLDVIVAAEPFAVTYGLFAPRVAISTALLDRASDAELQAVLAHERSHLRGRDPLKVFAVRVLLQQAFHLPILRHLRTRFIAGRELAADRCAVAACGRKPLAGALLTVVAGPPPTALAPATAFGAPALLDVRLAQLESGKQPRLPRPSLLTLLASAFGATVAVWAATGSILLLLRMCPCLNA